jgi:hypothetical protein
MSSGKRCAEKEENVNPSHLQQMYARVQKLKKAEIAAANRVEVKIEKSDKESNSSDISRVEVKIEKSDKAPNSSDISSAASSSSAPVSTVIDLRDSPEPETKANAKSDTIVID